MWIEYYVSVERSPEGTSGCIERGVLIDITESMKQDQVIEAAREREAVATIAAGVARGFDICRPAWHSPRRRAMNKAPTMVIADDHPLLRDGLKEHFAGDGGFVVLGEVDDAHAAIMQCRQHQPDVLLLDVEMPGRDPLGAMVDIKAAGPKTRIVILTAFCRESVIDVAVRGGAAGYLLKSDAPQDTLAALARVLKGERVYSGDVLARLSRPGRGAGQVDDRQRLGIAL